MDNEKKESNDRIIYVISTNATEERHVTQCRKHLRWCGFITQIPERDIDPSTLIRGEVLYVIHNPNHNVSPACIAIIGAAYAIGMRVYASDKIEGISVTDVLDLTQLYIRAASLRVESYTERHPSATASRIGSLFA